MKNPLVPLATGLFLVATAWPAPAAAQGTTDRDAWLAWHGCWIADGAPPDEKLCIVPHDDGVRLVTVSRGAIVGESQVVADGRARPVRHEDCAGSERARWSQDRRRVFLESQLSCAGSDRRASGMFAFDGTTTWLSVQSVETGGEIATATVRYSPVEPLAVPAAVASALPARAASVDARIRAAAAVDDNALAEIAANLDAAAVDEWLRATGQTNRLAAHEGAYGSALAQTAGGYAAAAVTYAVSPWLLPFPLHHQFRTHGFRSWRVVRSPFVYVSARPFVISTSTSSFGRRHPSFGNPRDGFIVRPDDRRREPFGHWHRQPERMRPRDRGAEAPRPPRAAAEPGRGGRGR